MKGVKQMKIMKISAKEMNEKYCGQRGGYITGAHYAIYEDGKGFCSLDGKKAYILKGNSGKSAMQSIIDAGGFTGNIHYVPAI